MNYKQKYKKHFDYGDDEIILCEVCGRPAVHIHHIEFKQMGGKKKKIDRIDNLISLCHNCHNEAHGIGNQGKLEPETLKEIVARRFT